MAALDVESIAGFGLRGEKGVTPQSSQAPTDGGEQIWGAAFRQTNSVVSAIQHMRNSGSYAPQAGYNPLTDIRGWKEPRYFLDHGSSFIGSQSPAETLAIKGQIDQEDTDKKTLAANGKIGFVASTMAGMLDPTMLLPGGVALDAAKGGLSFTKAAVQMGKAGLMQTTAQEALLQGTQQTRELSESALNIASGTLLTALIGGGAASLLSPAERASLNAKLHADRAAINEHAGNPSTGEDAPAMPGSDPGMGGINPAHTNEPASIGRAASAGAAASDTRQLDLVPALGLERLPFDPLSRVFNSTAVPAKRALAELADVPSLFEQNLRGESTTLMGGPPVEVQARLSVDQNRIQLADEIDRLYSEYRFGEQRSRPRLRAGFDDLIGRNDENLLSVDDFKREISIAAMTGDTHEIPQVQAAAQFWRKQTDGWASRAEHAIDGFQRKEFGEGKSYFPHMFNKAQIEARRPEFTNIIVSHLAADQAAKAQSKEKLGLYQGALDSHLSRIETLQTKIETLSADAGVIQARAEEATRVNKAAFQRATTLREGDRPIENARGGAVFETKARNRGNDLQDRASAKLAEIDTLEQKLATEIQNSHAMREKIETEIAAWEGKSAAEAKSALKARAEAEKARAAKPDASTERLSSADAAIERAVRNILESHRDLSLIELRDKAHEIVEHILGSPAGRFNYDMASGGPRVGFTGGGAEPARGSLHGRNFEIDTNLIRDFIETDIEHVNNAWMRTVVPDTLLSERFGDVEMIESFRKTEDHYAQLIDRTKNEKDRQKLAGERRAVIRDLAAVRDRIRGIYGMDAQALMPNAARVMAVVKNVNVPLSMGVSALSSLPDAAGTIFHHGMISAFGDGYIPWIRSLAGGQGFRLAGDELRAMSLANETFLASRHHEISDIMDSVHPQSRLERTLQWGASRFQLVSLLAQWTDWAKKIAGTVAMANILRATKDLANGSATERQLRLLGESNITPQLAHRIHVAWAGPEGGSIVDGVHLANSASWVDREAREAFQGALARNVNMAVITPGQEKPLLMSNPLFNILTQFQGFTAAAHQRILISGLQRRDSQVLQGLVFSMGLGMISYKLNSLTGGQPTSAKPQDWIKESISRGNILGWMEWGNALASKTTGGALDVYRTLGAGKPLSRYASRSALDQLLGPTAGKVQNVLKVTSAVGRADWSEADTKALRRMIAAQNLFYVRGLFDKVESFANGAFGIPMRSQESR